MNIHLIELTLKCRRTLEVIPFSEFSYFHGPMGAGKSSIAKLIDYCLGGDFELSPAMQAEFVWAAIALKVEENNLSLHRERDSDTIRAHWTQAGEPFEVRIPARKPSGIVVPNTGVEVLSDLVFRLAGKTPPKVRRSKIKEDSDLGRLSIRDLLWYCYLDQDSMDSSFFELDANSHPFKRLKSRDVLRYIVGFYQEHVSDLEVQLDELRSERVRLEAAGEAINEALTASELASELEIAAQRNQLEAELNQTEVRIAEARQSASTLRTHASDALRVQGKALAEQITYIEQTIDEVKQATAEDKTHRNELLALGTRFRRAQSARAVLGGVNFMECPRCAQTLPSRATELCSVCGQTDVIALDDNRDENIAQTDLDSRVSELTELITRQENQAAQLIRTLREVSDKKAYVDADLNAASSRYDSVVLSNILASENRKSALRQELLDLKKLEVLVARMNSFQSRIQQLASEESNVRLQLRDARERAERDAGNVSKLKHYFLDCLLRSKLPGIYESDIVDLPFQTLEPQITSATGGLTITSFSTLSSGGKKTLFKCCFAVAVHRLAAEIGAALPSLLVIDSPMKNISERENKDQYEHFHRMLYELAESELEGTQFVLIDKEYLTPPEGFGRSFHGRYMTPDDADYPPLISYYRGK